jgi:TP901 family phage tail tape measure protein
MVDVLVRARAEGMSAFGEAEGGLNKLAKAGLATAAVLGGAMVAGLGESVKAAADFQGQMTELVTGAGEVKDNLNLVSTGILKMAGDVGQSASSLASGMYMIESAGFHGADGLKVLQSAAEGAKVGNSDLATTADAVTTVLKDYHMAAGQATDATNFLVAVVSQGKTHMQDLAGSLAAILPTASALGVPLDQIGGGMATLTARGVPAADAATYLRFTLSALAAETPKGAKALQGIGLTSKEVGDTLTKQGLLPALQLIQEHLSKKFPQGGAAMFAVLKDITGGTRGLGAALGLTGENLATFEEATAKVSAQIKDGKGQVIGWDEVQGDFNQKMDRLKYGMQAASITLATALLPYVAQLADLVSSKVFPALERFGTALTNVTNALQHGGGAYGAVVAFLTTLGVNFQTAHTAAGDFSAGLSGLGLVAQKTGDTVKGFAGFVGELNKLGLLVPILSGIAAGWLAWNVVLIVNNIQLAINAALAGGPGLVAFLIRVVAATAAMGPLNVVTALWNLLLNLNPIGLVIIGIALLIAGIVLLITHWNQVIAVVTIVWTWIQNVVGANNLLGEALRAILGPIAFVITHWNDVITVVRDVIGWLGHAGDTFNWLGTQAHSLVDAIGSAFSTIGTHVHDGLKSARDTIVSFLNMADNIPLLGGILSLQGLTAANVPGFAQGGVVPGPLGAGDVVAAMLSPGEVVLNRSAVAQLGGAAAANALNKMGAGPDMTPGTWGGQCVVFVEALTGAHFPVAYASQMSAYVNDSSEAAGTVGVSTIPPYGHTWMNLGNGQVIDSNWVGNQTIGIHALSDIPNVVGDIRGLSVSGLPAAAIGMLDLPGQLKKAIASAVGGLGGWQGAVAKGLLEAAVPGLAKKFDAGGWLQPGATMAYNGTGQPEQVLPAGASAGMDDTNEILAAIHALLDQRLSRPTMNTRAYGS